MATSKEGSGVRVRLRFPKDADGLMDYLKSLDPETLSGAVYQLAYLGFLFKNNLMPKGPMAPVPMISSNIRPDAVASEASAASPPAAATVESGSEDAELNSFGRMFGDTYKLAAH